jgi:hypothetical protein
LGRIEAEGGICTGDAKIYSPSPNCIKLLLAAVITFLPLAIFWQLDMLLEQKKLGSKAG